MYGKIRNTVALGWIFLALAVGAQEGEPPAATEEKAKAATLVVEEFVIDPAAPAVDTLCKLRVKVRNSGTATATSLGFRVAVGGKNLKVYERQLFMDALPPGKSTEVQLFNFWTTESLRPAPKDGKLKVVVELREAQEVEITTDDEGTEVWNLGDAIPGLPSSVEKVFDLGASK